MENTHNLFVKDIASHEVVTCLESESVQTAAQLMRDADIGSIVVTKNNKPIGIITERDIVVRVVAEGKEPNKTLVKDIMSSPLITIYPETSITEAMRLMAKSNIRRLVILNNGELYGIISSRDIIKVSPSLIDILSEMASSNIMDEPYIESTVAGICDGCGLWSDSLTEVNGLMLCENCREEQIEG